jgi:acyl-CoA synthetase (AMP-forming)/AMP-acid ligase II
MAFPTRPYQQLFATFLAVHEDKTALILESGNHISYVQLDERVDVFKLNVADAFKRYSTGDDEPEYKKLFFILMDNSLASLVSYLFCLREGHVALLLSPDTEAGDLSTLVKCYQTNGILRSHLGETSIEVCSNTQLNLHADLAILLSTSGSTGSPKQVRLSRQNIQENAVSISQYLSIKDDERAITSLPPHYSYGLSVINSHLLAGASIVLTNESVVSRVFWDLFKTHGATSLAGVPYTYEVLDKLRFLRMNLPTLRYMTQAGGRLSKGLVELFSTALAQQGKRFYVMYGQTEATARIAYLSGDQLSHYPDSIGMAIPQGSLSLKDEQGRLIEQVNVAGELVYQGPNVMMGYALGIADLSKSSVLSELNTGDIAYRNEAGCYFIVGRSKRIAKVFGLRIDLDDLERVLSENDLSAFVIELASKLVLVLDNKNHQADLSNYVTDILKLHSASFEVVILTDIPRTSNGKVNYAKLSVMCGGSKSDLAKENDSEPRHD